MLRGDIVKGRFGILRSIYGTGIISISNDSSKSHGYHVQIARLRRTKVMEDAPRLLKIPEAECPDVWIRLPRHKWPKSWDKIEEPVVLLERNLYGHPLARLFWERQFEEALLEPGWENIPNWECMFVHRKQGLFLSVYVDDIKLAGKKQKH